MDVLTGAAKAARTLRAEGWSGLAGKLVTRAARSLSTGDHLDVQAADIVDSATVRRAPAPPATPRGRSLDVGWVITAPGPASGGHTTMFRMVEALEAAGHRCVLFVHDGQGGAGAQYEALIRTWWPAVRAEVRDTRGGLPPMDAYVATAWPTAHVLAKHDDVPGHRFYLAQDYEPYFYARGSVSTLAEDTYRFGFQTITIGHMVADELATRFGLRSVVAEFGCDTATYRVLPEQATAPRRDVAFYAKPGTARRGFELGVLALEQFHAAHPDVTIHTFGVSPRRLPFPTQAHAHVSPAELNRVYQGCAAGLAMSFTNISLIAAELLAAGVVPVVNDWAGSRADLDNPYAVWARPTPAGLAAGIERAVALAGATDPSAISASVAGVSWDQARRVVVETVEATCAGQFSASSPVQESIA